MIKLIANSTCQLHISRINSNSPRVYSAQIGVFVDLYKITFGRELQKFQGTFGKASGLSKVFLANFSNEPAPDGLRND